MGRRLCLAIGVADAPPLDYLPGAITGAHAIADWARGQGYETALLTDAEAAIAVEDVRAALARLLGNADCDRLIVYFAGHGLSNQRDGDVWLTSGWRKRQESIAVTALTKRLDSHGIRNLVIISDACRMVAASDDTRDLDASGVVDRGAFERTTPQIDMFKAASGARAAYMIPGAPSRCIFSGLLVEILAGAHPEAFAEAGGLRRIEGWSLAKYLKAEVPKLAARYNVGLDPEAVPGLFPPDNIYLDAPPAVAPMLVPWPDPATAGATGMGIDPDGRIAPPSGASWTSKQQGAGVTLLHERARVGLDGLAADDRALIAEADAADGAREKDLRQRLQNEERPTHAETGAAFSLHGAVLALAYAGPDAAAMDHGRPGWWRLEPASAEALDGPLWKGSIPMKRPVPLLVELDDGRYAGAAVVPDFVTSFTIGAKGVESLILRQMFGPPAADTEATMARLAARGLAGDDSARLAGELRGLKHLDPMLGVLAAYLHERVGDIANVRRTAAFMAHGGHRGSPGLVPFDLVLLGRIPVRRGADGALRAHVPAVAEVPETGLYLPHYLRCHTAAADAPVAGSFPWMSRGWALLEDDGEDGLYPPGMAALRRHLADAPFTTLDADGGRMLRAMLEG